MDALASFPEWLALPLDEWISDFVDWLQANAQWLFDLLQTVLWGVLRPVQEFLLWMPWAATTALLALIAYALRGWKVAGGVVLALVFVGSLGLWNLSMVTLALVLTATVVCMVVGVPVGVLMALSSWANALIRPVLDFMQTMPSFVYLVPAVMLMGLGKAPALIAVVIYAIPPVIRLTNLGIRNVQKETVEAGMAFGATPGQLLRKVQLPLGFPTLMAGVNQTIMMALAMVIVASLINAGGLGTEVLVGLSRLNVGQASTAGIAIVVLAIIIDRISEGASEVGTRRRAKRARAREASEDTDQAAAEDDGGLVARDLEGKDDEPEIVLEGVYKIFGPNPRDARHMLESGVSKEDILAKTRSTIGVDDVSLEVYPGETFVIMGLSGSGKSTLVRCLNRLVEPTDGRIEIGGEDVRSMDRTQLNELRRRKLGMVFQRFALLPHRSVLDNVTFGLEVQGIDREEREQAGRRVLGIVGLSGWADSYPDELSGGMQQRVGLARALANDPDILLMDEPFSALDPLMRRQLQAELTDLQQRLRKTIVFITHDLDEALRLGDRIAIMKDGKVVQLGTPEDILLRPADDYVQAFIEGHDKSEVLTARDVMFRADSRVRATNSPQVALRAMEQEGLSSAFVVDAEGRFAGLVTADAAIEAAKQGVGQVSEIATDEVATASPDDRMRDLIPSAISSPYPIAVLDGGRKLLGIVARVSILKGLIADEAEATADTDAPEPASTA